MKSHKNHNKYDNANQHVQHQHGRGQDVHVKLVKHPNAESKHHGTANRNNENYHETAKTHNNNVDSKQSYGSTFTDFRQMSIKDSSSKAAVAKPMSQVNGSSNHHESAIVQDSALEKNNSSHRFLKKNKQLKVDSPKDLMDGTIGTPRPHIDVPGKDSGANGKNSTYTVSFNATGQQQSQHDSPQADRRGKVSALFLFLPPEPIPQIFVN